MGLFGPSLNEKIRRTAATALPKAEWKVDVDWSTGSKLHQLQGTLRDTHTDEETMKFARDVWQAVAKDYRLHPEDARDGLLVVGVSAAGGSEQRTGIHG